MQLTTNFFTYHIIAFFVIILLRYFLIAGGAYLLLYLPFSQALIKPELQNHSLRWIKVKNDIMLSVISTAVFAIVGAFVWSSYQAGGTRLYTNLHWQDLWYLVFSYVLVLILQDTYFYFTHRLFHHRALFHWCHQGHHQSRHPTPLTSFAFDPLEAIVQSLFLIAIVFIIPLHLITLVAVLSTMTVWAVVNHLGVERLPGGLTFNWLGQWFIGPVHHGQHHLKYTVHYGLYFTFWDKLMRT